MKQKQQLIFSSRPKVDNTFLATSKRIKIWCLTLKTSTKHLMKNSISAEANGINKNEFLFNLKLL